MKTRNFLLLPLFLILFSSVIIPFSYASVESEAQEDIRAGCREGNTLVYRFAHADYICVDPSTAERWEELKLAEIVLESSDSPRDEKPPQLKPQFETTNPPQLPLKTIRDTSDDSECREGYTLVYRLIHHDIICTSPSTAASWERLGLAEIISSEKNIILDEEEILASVEEKPQPVEEKPQPVEEKPQPVEEKPQPVEEVNFLKKDSNDYIYDDGLELIEEDVWIAVDSDSKIFLIEGEKGIIVINSLDTFESNKKIFDEFKLINDKPVKVLIFTKITPQILQASKVILENNENISIIIHEDVLEQFIDDYDLDVPNAITFSSQFEINASGIPKMNLAFNEGNISDQTIIHLEKYDVVMIGDSGYGLSPYLIRSDSLRNLLTE